MGGSCFPAGTKVTMGNGSYKNIEEVVPNDIVLSYNEDTLDTVEAKCLEIESPVRDHMYTLTFSDGTTLGITDEHPIYIRKADGYVGWAALDALRGKEHSPQLDVKQFKFEDQVLNTNLEWVSLTGMTYEPGDVQTYSLRSVEFHNNFFVDGKLVHNCGGGGGDGDGDSGAGMGDPGGGAVGSTGDGTAGGMGGSTGTGSGDADGAEGASGNSAAAGGMAGMGADADAGIGGSPGAGQGDSGIGGGMGGFGGSSTGGLGGEGPGGEGGAAVGLGLASSASEAEHAAALAQSTQNYSTQTIVNMSMLMASINPALGIATAIGMVAGQNATGMGSNTGNDPGDSGAGGEGGLSTAQRTAPASSTPAPTGGVTSSPTDLNPFEGGDWWDNKLRQDAANRIGLKQMRQMDPRYASMLNTFVPMAE